MAADPAAGFEVLAGAIEEAEAAWAGGRLGAALDSEDLEGRLGEQFLPIYHRLLRAGHPPPAPFRRNFVRGLVEAARGMLAAPQVRFDAEAVTRERSVPWFRPAGSEPILPPSPVLVGLLARSASGETRLRLDQIVAMRFWGIGYGLEDNAFADELAAQLQRRAMVMLAADLRDMELIEARLGSRLPADVTLVSDDRGRRFEHLMMDLLNELRFAARHARLSEDILEKTDLRFRDPSLQRNNGARLQVTQTIAEERHVAKLLSIRHVEEFVVLSPRSLAQALASPQAVRLLAREEVEALWALVPRSAGVDELAACFRGLFQSAIASAQAHPLGPVTAVPETLRRLVRAYVLKEALASTGDLRKRQAKGQWHGRRRRLTFAQAPPAAEPPPESHVDVAGESSDDGQGPSEE